ncbi:MAG: hypothetical protein EXS17_07690 [Phycisphaerales bacterium]|nr:hypothetical protein [Phycisphaerales bacterium]
MTNARRLTIRSCAGALAAVCIVVSAVAQTPPESPDQPAQSAPISPSELPASLPAIERLGAAQLEPPAATQSKQVTPAQEAAELRASGRFLAPLIPEGGLLVRACGTLGRDEFLGVWTFELSDRVEGAQNRSLILLPAEPLADMIVQHTTATTHESSPPLFEVSGRVLVYRGSNFLLPTFAVPVDRRITRPAPRSFVPPGAQRAAQAIAATAPAARSAVPVAVVVPSSASTEPIAAPSVDPESFSRDLEARLDARIAVVPSSGDPSLPADAAPAGVEQPSVATVQANDSANIEMPMIEARTTAPTAATTVLASRSATPLLPPMRIQSRRGTLTRDPVSGTWRFIFASGVKDEGDLSLELLPCTTLTSLVNSKRSRSGVSNVLLTADVTVFEGRNFLRPVRYQPLVSGKWIAP